MKIKKLVILPDLGRIRQAIESENRADMFAAVRNTFLKKRGKLTGVVGMFALHKTVNSNSLVKVFMFIFLVSVIYDPPRTAVM